MTTHLQKVEAYVQQHVTHLQELIGAHLELSIVIRHTEHEHQSIVITRGELADLKRVVDKAAGEKQ